jgi:hypothetical protein
MNESAKQPERLQKAMSRLGIASRGVPKNCSVKEGKVNGVL